MTGWRPRFVATLAGSLLLGAYLVTGLVWTLSNLGDFPHYGDTIQYLQLARELEVDEHRGILYPAILAVAGHLFVEDGLPARLLWTDEKGNAGGPCAAPDGLISMQLLQMALGFLCLAYFLQIVLPPGRLGDPENGPRSRLERHWTWALLLALLLLDPIIAHFNLALMSDGLTFSACLAFCAALVDFSRREARPFLPGAVLFLSYLTASGLRVEKRWILLLTAVAALLIWRATAARTGFSPRPGRPLAAILLVGLGWLSTTLVHGAVYRDSDWMPLGDSALHLRIVFPHLSEVYDDLPEHTRSYISREDARFYDQHVNHPYRLMGKLTRNDPELRRTLNREMLWTVLPRRWHVIALDTARDAAENLLSTVSFYSRVAVWRTWGSAAIDRWFFSDAAVWDYQRLVFHHPRLSAFHMTLFVALALFSLVVTLKEGRQRRRISLAVWTPAFVLWVLNALAFTAYVNIINVRYMIISHALLLILIYRPAVEWLLYPWSTRARKRRS